MDHCIFIKDNIIASKYRVQVLVPLQETINVYMCAKVVFINDVRCWDCTIFGA